MSISEIILFLSRASTSSKVCTERLDKMRLGSIQKVYLDTVNDRQRAMRGKYVSIKDVPTLAIIYNDGQMDLFEGVEKIIGKMENLISSRSPAQVEYIEPKKVSRPARTPKHRPPVSASPPEFEFGESVEGEVQNEEEPEEIEIPSKRLAPRGFDLGKNPNTDKTMTGTKEMARQMELQFKQQIEKNNPKAPRFSE